MKCKGEILLFTLLLHCCGYWYETHIILFMSQMTADNQNKTSDPQNITQESKDWTIDDRHKYQGWTQVFRKGNLFPAPLVKCKGEILLFTLLLHCCGYWYETHIILFMSQMTADIFSLSNTTGDTSGAGNKLRHTCIT
jgi:hypothetical protein